MQADGERSIYRQIADMIEDGILTGAYAEDEAIPSTNQFARIYQINPATANKGVSQLVDDGILYKKRGLGMYVAPGAQAQLHEKRKKVFFENQLASLLKEAKRLGISKGEIEAALARMDDS